jgi:hypothetical protein
MKTNQVKKVHLIVLFSTLFLLVLGGCEYEVVEPDRTPVTEEVLFSGKIIPIFNASCNFSGCHSAGAVPPDLTPAGAYASLMGLNQIDTVNPANSILYKSMTTGSMKNYSNADQAKLILAWIEQGAKNN